MLLSEMGGRIEVESAPNKGSTFRILLAKAHGDWDLNG
jgi:signal transduction histidine kinase